MKGLDKFAEEQAEKQKKELAKYYRQGYKDGAKDTLEIIKKMLDKQVGNIEEAFNTTVSPEVPGEKTKGFIKEGLV